MVGSASRTAAFGPVTTKNSVVATAMTMVVRIGLAVHSAQKVPF
jgi:hypothetical protein